MGRRRRAVGGLLVVFASVAALFVAGAGADITTPTDGQVVRDGSVTITENRGGVSSGLCAGATSFITVTRVADGVVVHNEQKPPSGLLQTRSGPWSTTFVTEGQPAGDYRITMLATDRSRVGFSCVSTQYFAPPVVFTYRPWQQSFDDFFGGGSVSFNTSPEEFSFAVGGSSAPVFDGAAGAAGMELFGLPDATTFALPADPASCQADPQSCIPAAAVPCDPSAGCTPRLVFINHSSPGNTLVGLFDLDTRAFVALAQTGGNTRVLISGGTTVDDALRTTYAAVVAAAAANGIDLPALLAQPVVLKLENGDETHELTVSLLEGIQLTTRDTVVGPAGPLTLAAGLIVHVGEWSGPEQEDGTSGYGYAVQEAGILPAIPSGLPSLAALLLSGGKIRHVVGTVPEGGGQHTIALSADTQPGEPNGLPVWIPLVSGSATVADNGVQFIGDDLLVLSIDICLFGQCGGGGALIGTGLALFPQSPLERVISIGDIPALWTQCSMAAATPDCPEGPIQLITEVDGVLADVAAQVLGNPTVQEALAALDPVLAPLLDQLPELPV